MSKKKKNKPRLEIPSQPYIFDLRDGDPAEWDRMQALMPPEIFLSFLHDVLECPCCGPQEKEQARRKLGLLYN